MIAGALRADSPTSHTDVRLNGDWIVESTETHGGKTNDFNGSRFRIDGNSFEWTIGRRVLNRTLIVDRTKHPNCFDQLIAGPAEQKMTILGIYQFKNETLRVCFTNSSGERPRNFETAPDHPELTLVLKRAVVAASLTPTQDGG